MGAAQCAAGVRSDFSGNWRKDKGASQMDCYAKQLDLLQLQGVQKNLAQKLINGLQIQQNDEGRSSLSSRSIRGTNQRDRMTLSDSGPLLSAYLVPVKAIAFVKLGARNTRAPNPCHEITLDKCRYVYFLPFHLSCL
jgi:hypothetical protein